MNFCRPWACWLLVLAAGSRLATHAVESHGFTNLNRLIPDGNLSGLSDTHSITSTVAQLTSLRVWLRVAGEFNGDLYAYLRHVGPDRTNLCVLLNRPGRTVGNAAGYAHAGLDVVFDDAALAGDAHLYGATAAPSPGAPWTGTWQPDGRAVDPTLVTDASPRTTTLGAFAGGSPSGQWTLYLLDAESGGTNQLESWGVEVEGRLPAPLTWATPADIVYGTALGGGQLNATSSIPGTYGYSPPSGTVLNAGNGQTLSVTFTPVDTNLYTPVIRSVLLNVLKKDLLITANNAHQVYGTPMPGLTSTCSGYVNGDDETCLDTPIQLATAATPSSPTGAYPITASGATDANYAISFAEGVLTVTPSSTTGQLSVSPNPSPSLSTVFFSFRAQPVAPGGGTPTGTVRFRLNGSEAGTVALTNAWATLSRTDIPFGTYGVTAEYAGDGNFYGVTNTLAAPLIVNTPPTAGPDTITRTVTNGTKVGIAVLLANDFPGDAGDTLSLVWLPATSANGAQLTQSNGWVFYIPVTASTNLDTFTYEVVDSLGATATGIVTVTSVPGVVPAMNLVIHDLGNGTLLLQFNGIPEAVYSIEQTLAIDPPSWQTLVTTNADLQGIFAVVVPMAPPTRFYRSVYR